MSILVCLQFIHCCFVTALKQLLMGLTLPNVRMLNSLCALLTSLPYSMYISHKNILRSIWARYSKNLITLIPQKCKSMCCTLFHQFIVSTCLLLTYSYITIQLFRAGTIFLVYICTDYSTMDHSSLFEAVRHFYDKSVINNYRQ